MSSRLVYASKLEEYQYAWPIKSSRPIFRTQPTMYHHHTRCDTIGRNDIGKKHIWQSRLRRTEDNNNKSNITGTSSLKNYPETLCHPIARGQRQSRPFCPYLEGFYRDSLISSEFLAGPPASVFRTVQSVRPGGRTGRTPRGSPSFFDPRTDYGIWSWDRTP